MGLNILLVYSQQRSHLILFILILPELSRQAPSPSRRTSGSQWSCILASRLKWNLGIPS